MFQAGDLIVYGRIGVCRVDRLEELKGRQYYVLDPLYQSCSIKVPVDSKLFMRPIITREEANALIDGIPNVTGEPCTGKPARELTRHYQGYLEQYVCADLLKMNISIRAKKEAAYQNRRKFGVVDERYMKEGMALLHGELAAALGIPVKEVPQYIAQRLGREPMDLEKLH